MIRWTLTFFVLVVIVAWGSSYVWSWSFTFPYPGQGRDVEIESLTGRLSVTVQDQSSVWGYGYGMRATSVRVLRDRIDMANDVGIPMEMPKDYARYLWLDQQTVTLNSGQSLSWTTSALPYWIILIVVGLYPAFLWARWVFMRSPSDRTCRKCGYDLRGSSGGDCPECGFAESSEQIRTPS